MGSAPVVRLPSPGLPILVAVNIPAGTVCLCLSGSVTVRATALVGLPRSMPVPKIAGHGRAASSTTVWPWGVVHNTIRLPDRMLGRYLVSTLPHSYLPLAEFPPSALRSARTQPPPFHLGSRLVTSTVYVVITSWTPRCCCVISMVWGAIRCRISSGWGHHPAVDEGS